MMKFIINQIKIQTNFQILNICLGEKLIE